jgi:hypothetical protein
MEHSVQGYLTRISTDQLLSLAEQYRAKENAPITDTILGHILAVLSDGGIPTGAGTMHPEATEHTGSPVTA